jgi:hypothetical protein
MFRTKVVEKVMTFYTQLHFSGICEKLWENTKEPQRSCALHGG